MYYFDYRRIRRGLTVFASVLAGLIVLQLILVPFSTVHDHGVIVSSSQVLGLHAYALLHDLLQNVTIPFAVLCAFAGVLATFTALGSGTTLSRQNASLHFLLVKPRSRVRLALETIGCDVVGFIAAFAIALALLCAPLAAFGGHFAADGRTFYVIALGVGNGLMTYALIQAVSVRLRNGGAVVGIAIGAGVLLAALGQIKGGGPLGAFVAIIELLNKINPIEYFGAMFANSGIDGKTGLLPDSFVWLATVWITTLVALAVAVVLRDRAEI